MTVITGGPFFTLPDPQIAIRGSMDPLGAMQIWGRLGREVVGNLTTVTTSARGFTTLLLGYWLAGRVVDEGRADESQILPMFLKLEQQVAYSRVVCTDKTHDNIDGIRGVRRVKQHLGGGRAVRISDDRDGQILSNQKMYGLWGLYTVAARSSGLLHSQLPRIVEAAAEHLERVVEPVLRRHGLRNGERIVRRMVDGGPFAPLKGDADVARALAELHRPAYTEAELSFYQEWLLRGGTAPVADRQSQFWDHLRAVVDKRRSWDQVLDRRELLLVRDRAAKAAHEDLVIRLDHILAVEAVLAPIGRLFDWILTAHDRSFSELVDELATTWRAPLDHIDPDRVRVAFAPLQENLSEERMRLLDDAAVALQRGAWSDAVRVALRTNELVMRDRGAGPWATLKDGRIDVRYRDAGGDLPARDDLPDLWVNPYYLSPLKRMGCSLLHPELGDEDLG